MIMEINNGGSSDSNQGNNGNPNVTMCCIKPYISEQLIDSGTPILRVFSNNIYQYVDNLPFTTVNLLDEESNGLWVLLLKGSVSLENLIPYQQGMILNTRATIIYDNRIFKLSDSPNLPYTVNDIDQDIIDENINEISVAFPKPLIGKPVPLIVGQGVNVNVNIPCKYLEENSTVEIGNLVLQNVEIDPFTDKISLFTDTTGIPLGNYDIKIRNSSGESIYDTPFEIATNTEIIPNSAIWTVHQGGFTFADGKIAPSDLNITNRYAYFDAIPADLDFEFEAELDTNAIAGASSNNNSFIGITYTDDLSFDLTDNIAPFGISYINGPYVYGSYSATFLAQGGWGSIFKMTRNSGVLKILVNSVFPAVTVRYTFPDVVNNPLRIICGIPNHAGFKSMKLTIIV